MAPCPPESYQAFSVLSWLHVIIVPVNLQQPSLLVKLSLLCEETDCARRCHGAEGGLGYCWRWESLCLGGCGRQVWQTWARDQKIWNLGSTQVGLILKSSICHIITRSRDITLPTKVHIVKAMVLPVVMYGCERWTIKKTKCWRIDAFKMWYWRRLLKVHWTERRSS